MKVSELLASSGQLSGLNNINVLMGRNGAGKSRFLRAIEVAYRGREDYYVRYVSPERAGTFRRDGSILTAMSQNAAYLAEVRAMNQAENFKAASATLLRETELLYLRRLASVREIRLDETRNFETDRLEKINQLLTNISLVKTNTDFEFRSIADGTTINPNQISSGESEVVSLASEILYFFDTVDDSKFNLLLLDEPDVHLHPDLQARLGKLLVSMLNEFSKSASGIAVCLATHSAPLVCSLANSANVSIGTKSFNVDSVEMKPVRGELRKIAPFLGHPLSLSLNNDAALILEGEDDERVWQQAARSSQGLIKIFPVLSGTVDQQSQLEDFSVELLKTLYDDPVAFSLRDGDGVIDGELEHRLPLRRYRLACYAIENILITDQALDVMGKTWPEFTRLAESWLEHKQQHQDRSLVQELIGSIDRLRQKKIKNIRQLICTIAECTKPWEVVAGQAIAAIKQEDLGSQNMLVEFLGEDMVRNVVFRS